MIDVKRTVVCLLVILIAGFNVARASSAPPAEEGEKGFPSIRKTSNGEILVQDPTHDFQLRLPAPYWQCKSPGQIAQESQGGSALGCSPGGQKVPSSLLLVIRNQDARAAASLELKPDRFRMRGRQDLEEYVNNRHNMVMKEGGNSFKLQDSQYGEQNGVITHRAVYTATQNNSRQKYVLVDYFVRPKGKKARVYQLACISTPEVYDRLKSDFETIIKSFEYTGPLAESFFTPNASPSELPSEKEGGGGSMWGGKYSGMIIAMGIVFLLYMFFRRRSGQSGF